MVPDKDYLRRAYELCKEHNVLMIADEVQTGIARTGRMLCSEHSGIKPDITLLGKAISGGAYPVSAVLSSREIMLCLPVGSHGSTYGGNPLGCRVAMAALQVVKDEGLIERSERLGIKFRKALEDCKAPTLKMVRGMGLLNAIIIDESKSNGRSAWDLCLLMRSNGLLAKPTHGNIVRLAPPLVIDEADLMRGADIIKRCLAEFPTADIIEFQD